MTLTLRRRAGRLTSALLLLVAVAFAALFLVPKALGYDLYVITTGSMSGTVDPGGLVIADRVPVAELAVGDVITYVPPASSRISHLVTHRIVEIGQDAAGSALYRTKGDANTSVDPWTFTLDSAVQPRMQWTVPVVGQPVLWLADRETRLLALALPALVIALLALREVVQVLRPQPAAARVIDLTDPQGLPDRTVAYPDAPTQAPDAAAARPQPPLATA